MKNFLAHTDEVRQELLDNVSCKSQDDLFKQIPVKFANFDMGEAMSELETQRKETEEVKQELETYKKIAEKLASVLSKKGIVTLQPIPPYNENSLLETVVINGKDEIIDWARNEVEKDA